MRAREKQLIEAYQRVEDFLGRHPPPDSPGYHVQKRALDDVVARLREHAIKQAAGRRLRHSERFRQHALAKELREQHLTPIAQIARATLADAPGIERALKMPPYRLGPLKLLAEARAMRGAAERYELQFVESGRPVDFLKQLDQAISALQDSMIGKARYLGTQVGSGAGIKAEIKRGRRVVELLDAIVRTAFHDDSRVLAEWRSAKRVRGLPGGSGGGSGSSPDGTLELAS
jgi:hypothetical protein